MTSGFEKNPVAHEDDEVTSQLRDPVTSQSSGAREEPNHTDTEFAAPDGGWGWVVLLASFLSSVIVDGVCFSFGIFYLEFLRQFGENKGKTAWIGSVLNGMYMIMGPVAGALYTKFGCRVVAITGSIWAAIAFFISTFSRDVNSLVVTYGVMGGIGFGLMYLPSIVVVGFYFDKKRALATGIATCGSGVGAFIMAPLSKALIDAYGWQGALWIMSGIVLNGTVLGALYRPLNERESDKHRRRSNSRVTSAENGYEPRGWQEEKNTQKPTGNPDETELEALRGSSEQETTLCGEAGGTSECQETNDIDKGCLKTIKGIATSVVKSVNLVMLKDPVFLTYAGSCILCMAGFFVPFIYLPAHAISQGSSSSQAAWLLAMLGATNTVGRVVTGFIVDRPWADCLLINNCALIIGGVATIACPFCTNYILLSLYACVFGLAIGTFHDCDQSIGVLYVSAAFVSLRSIILVELIGLDKLASVFGILVLCQGITSFVGAPFAGLLYDLTGSYNTSFYVAGSSVASAGIICLPLRRLARWRHSRQSTQDLNT